MILNKRTYIFLAGGALIIFGVLFLLFRSSLRGYFGDVWLADSVPTGTLHIGEQAIAVSIARSESEREQGLSDTPSLPENTGKLFVFPQAGQYGFWMKDMNYPIDIIWIDTDHTVLAVTPNAKPDSYPTVFYPPQPIQFVLEVPAGFSTLNLIARGQALTLEK